MKAVVVKWSELKEAIRQANKLERMLSNMKDLSQYLFWSTKIGHYCCPDDPLYRNEEYYQHIKKELEKLIESKNE